ncbi:MAG: polysaccharide deacetylase family protein [Candidatus Daviesbacteria bacterium]|nr:polysaccharide deacetylase family protein [Candidatus Daviesbacteria bacterium]
MPKKKQVKKNKPIAILIISLLVLVAVFVGVVYLAKVNPLTQPQQDNIQETGFNKLATPSATPKPTPRPNPIPAQRGKSVRVPILYYHYIGNNPNPADTVRDNLSVTPDRFDEEMGYLAKNGYSSITFDTLYASLNGNAPLPSKPIVISFDDGYTDFYFNAYPILRKYGLHAVSFIPTGLIGSGYYMNWNQIKEIDASGLVSFQAHSVTHPNLTVLSDDQLKYQIFESKKVLQDMLGKTVNTFAYPYGISDERAWNIVKSAGFVGAAGTWYGTIESEGTQFDMPRIRISGAIDLASFAAKL